MYRRLVWIELRGPGEATTPREQRPNLRGFAGGVLLVVLAAMAQTGLEAEDGKTTPPAAAKTREAVNVMWRCDGNGHFPNIHPLCEWSDGRNILWKTPVEIGGYSSPIVAGGKVFVTAEMGSLICLDLADGKVLWQKDLFSPDSKDIPADLSKRLMRGCGGESKQSTPTPTSNGKLVFYINAMGLCACYDLQGNRKWIRDHRDGRGRRTLLFLADFPRRPNHPVLGRPPGLERERWQHALESRRRQAHLRHARDRQDRRRSSRRHAGR